jgi:hypothetical protein
MKARIEAGTDIALVGAWDAALQREVLADRSDPAFSADASKARLFLIRTGGDGGGPVDVYVDEEMPPAVRRLVRKAGREHLLSVPSGRLMIGGVEDYRSATPRITDGDSAIDVPPGDYAIACFETPAEETGFDPPTAAQLEAALGAREYRDYRRIERIVLCGYLHLLWLPVLWPVLGWKWALGIMLVTLVAWMNVQERVLAKHVRYQAARARVQDVWKQAMRGGNPTLVLTLRRVAERGALAGGSVSLESPEEA